MIQKYIFKFQIHQIAKFSPLVSTMVTSEDKSQNYIKPTSQKISGNSTVQVQYFLLKYFLNFRQENIPMAPIAYHVKKDHIAPLHQAHLLAVLQGHMPMLQECRHVLYVHLGIIVLILQFPLLFVLKAHSVLLDKQYVR